MPSKPLGTVLDRCMLEIDSRHDHKLFGRLILALGRSKGAHIVAVCYNQGRGWSKHRKYGSTILD